MGWTVTEQQPGAYSVFLSEVDMSKMNQYLRCKFLADLKKLVAGKEKAASSAAMPLWDQVPRLAGSMAAALPCQADADVSRVARASRDEILSAVIESPKEAVIGARVVVVLIRFPYRAQSEPAFVDISRLPA